MEKGSASKGKTDWKKLRALKKAQSIASEAEIAEARNFWADADLVIPKEKSRLTVRFDSDLVEWFKSFGPKYQTRMNAALRQFMDNHLEEHADVSDVGGLHTKDHSSLKAIENHYLEALNQLGKISINQGDLDRASSCFLEVIRQSRSVFDRENIEPTVVKKISLAHDNSPVVESRRNTAPFFPASLEQFAGFQKVLLDWEEDVLQTH